MNFRTPVAISSDEGESWDYFPKFSEANAGLFCYVYVSVEDGSTKDKLKKDFG